MSYRIPDADLDLIKACIDRAEELVVHLYNNGPTDKFAPVPRDKIDEYRITFIRMLLDLDVAARSRT